LLRRSSGDICGVIDLGVQVVDEGARSILQKLARERVIDVDVPNAIADLAVALLLDARLSSEWMND
jgi:hypothetical protein